VTFRISLHRDARKFLERVQRPHRERIVSALRALEHDPFTARSGADIKRLHGTRGRSDLYRLRIGKFRAVYAVEGSEVTVTEIWERGHGYDI
jgi:mRNA interferase RelE/StbE